MRKWPETSWIFSRSIGAATAWFTVGLSLPASGQVDAPPIIINEVFFRGTNASLEFVELFNASSRPVDLSTGQFSDSRRKPVDITESRYVVDPGSYAIITRDVDAFDARFSFPARIEVSGWPTLNNSGDAVILWINGVATDSVVFSMSWGGNDVSLERIDPDGSSVARSNWAESLDRLGGTPGRLNSVFAPDVNPPRAVFCEEVEDGLFAVYFSEPVARGSVSPASFWFESGTGAEDAHLDSSEQVVWLRADASAGGSWVAVSGVSDLSGNVLADQEVEIAWLPEPGELIVNEIMYEPLTDEYDGLPNQTEYVELLSTSERLLSIRSLVWTDRLREDGSRDTTSLTDRRLALDPKSFVLVYAQGNQSEDPLAAFPDIDRTSPGLILLQISSNSLSFGNNGDKIRLERQGGVVIDEVDYAPSWHLAERIETRGVSLERVSSSGSSQNPSNWSSSVDPSGGTPGVHNSIRFDWQPVEEPVPLVIDPSPFSPDGDGFEDVAFINLTLDRPTAVARAWVFDLTGRLVIELEQALPVGPSSSLIWDGRGRTGDVMRGGLYVILVEIVDVGSGRVEHYKKPVALVRP